MLMEIGGGLFWRPDGPHQPCTSLSVSPLQRRAVVARPSFGPWGAADGPFWRSATAQFSLLTGLHWSSQEQTRPPSVGNMQELQSEKPE